MKRKTYQQLLSDSLPEDPKEWVIFISEMDHFITNVDNPVFDRVRIQSRLLSLMHITLSSSSETVNNLNRYMQQHTVYLNNLVKEL